PGGTVTFNDNNNAIAGCVNVQLAAGQGGAMQATCATSSLSVGFHPISVQDKGDTNFQMSTSPDVTETMQEAGNSNTMYLRLEGGQDVLDPAAPAGTTAQYLSTGPVNRLAYKKIGTWTAPPAASPAALGPGAAATVYLLLNNGDDAGTIFGLRGDVFNGAQLIGAGKLDNITRV